MFFINFSRNFDKEQQMIISDIVDMIVESVCDEREKFKCAFFFDRYKEEDYLRIDNERIEIRIYSKAAALPVDMRSLQDRDCRSDHVCITFKEDLKRGKIFSEKRSFCGSLVSEGFFDWLDSLKNGTTNGVARVAGNDSQEVKSENGVARVAGNDSKKVKSEFPIVTSKGTFVVKDYGFYKTVIVNGREKRCFDSVSEMLDYKRERDD